MFVLSKRSCWEISSLQKVCNGEIKERLAWCVWGIFIWIVIQQRTIHELGDCHCAKYTFSKFVTHTGDCPCWLGFWLPAVFQYSVLLSEVMNGLDFKTADLEVSVTHMSEGRCLRYTYIRCFSLYYVYFQQRLSPIVPWNKSLPFKHRLCPSEKQWVDAAIRMCWYGTGSYSTKISVRL